MVPGRERVFLCSSALRMLESTRYPIVAPQATQSVSCKSAVTALSSIEDDRKHTHISSDVTLICKTGGKIAQVNHDPGFKDLDPLTAMLKPFDPAQMKCYPVSALVNSPANDDPACAAEVEPSQRETALLF